MKIPGQLIVLLIVSSLLIVTGCNRNTPTPVPTSAPATESSESNGDVPSQPMTEQPSPNGAQRPQSEQPPSATATSTPDSVGTITLWHNWAEADGDALAMILLTFAEQYPEVQVNTLFVAYNDLPQSYAEAVQANAGPDLVLMPNWWLGEMVEAGVVQSIDTLVEQGLLNGNDVESFWPATLDNMRWEDELYGLPTNFELVTLFYNRSLIDPSDLPDTTAELLQLARADSTTGIGLYASLYHIYWGFPAYGAQLLDNQGRAILDRTTGAADYLTWLAELSQVDGTFVDSDYGMLLDRFKKSEFAFLVDGPWSIGELRQALGDDLAVTRLPAGTIAASQPWISAEGVFLNPTVAAEQQWLALLLARHITSVASGEVLADLANRLPAHRNVMLADPLLQGFLAQAASSQSLPVVPEMDEVWGYGGDLLIRVLDARTDPAQAVFETTTLINEANGK